MLPAIPSKFEVPKTLRATLSCHWAKNLAFGCLKVVGNDHKDNVGMECEKEENHFQFLLKEEESDLVANNKPAPVQLQVANNRPAPVQQQGGHRLHTDNKPAPTQLQEGYSNTTEHMYI